jgi:hypothetical protein
MYTTEIGYGVKMIQLCSNYLDVTFEGQSICLLLRSNAKVVVNVPLCNIILERS